MLSDVDNKKEFPKMKLRSSTPREHPSPEPVAEAKTEPEEDEIRVKTFTARPKNARRVMKTSGSAICDIICGKVYKNSSYVVEHMKRHLDLDRKPYKCELCDRGFTMPKDLKNHIKSHLKERPFRCIICDKSYTRKSLLNYHTRTHTGERPYKCEFCGMGFSRPFALTSHINTRKKLSKCFSMNKPFDCAVCSKSFASNKTLQRHAEIRHNQNNLIMTCPSIACSKTYNNKYSMEAHIRNKHSNEALIKCPLCSMSFIMKLELNKHLKSAHQKSHLEARTVKSFPDL